MPVFSHHFTQSQLAAGRAALSAGQSAFLDNSYLPMVNRGGKLVLDPETGETVSTDELTRRRLSRTNGSGDMAPLPSPIQSNFIGLPTSLQTVQSQKSPPGSGQKFGFLQKPTRPPSSFGPFSGGRVFGRTKG